MGEYEPEDSRNVTQSDRRAPGEPPRTGPREDEARRKAERKKDADEAERMPGSQQKSQQQSQDQRQAGQSQSQSGRAQVQPGNPDRQNMQAEPGGAAAGNQPQAIDNRSGASAPQYDQYEVNQPQNMHQQNPDQEEKVRQQARVQDDGDRGFGYGAEGGEEMRDAPDSSEHASESLTDRKSEGGDAPGAELRGYGGRGEAAQQAKTGE